MKRDMFSHGNDKGHFCLDGFLNGTGGLVSGNVYTSCIRLEFLHGLTL